MKWSFLFIFFLTACSQLVRTPAGVNGVKHVVFDIDWTIVSEIKTAEGRKLPSTRMIEVEGHQYFINEGLEEFIQNILDKKDVEISFFSGGSEARNLELLSKIRLKDNRSLKDIAFKILNFEDLVKVEDSDNVPFSQKYKKDLSKISSNLDQLIMFDDTYDFVLETTQPQNNYVFYIGTTLEYFESFNETVGLTGKYIPASYEQWLLNNKKLYVLNQAFNAAYDEASNESISFSEALKKQEDLLNLKSGQWSELSERYYRIGYQVHLNKKNQELLKCNEGIKLLMGF